MGHSTPTTAASTCLTMTSITSTPSLSAPAPSGPPSTSNILSMLKPPVQRPPYKTWPIHHPIQTLISSPIHSDWSSEEDWDSTKQKERERISKIIRRDNRKVAEEERRKKAKKEPFQADHVSLTYLVMSQMYPSPTL